MNIYHAARVTPTMIAIQGGALSAARIKHRVLNAPRVIAAALDDSDAATYWNPVGGAQAFLASRPFPYRIGRFSGNFREKDRGD